MILRKIEIDFKDDVNFNEIVDILCSFSHEYSEKQPGYMSGYYYHKENNIWVYYTIFDNIENVLKATSGYTSWRGADNQIIKTKDNGISFSQYEIIENLL